MKVQLINDIIENIYGIARFNQEVVTGTVGYRDYEDVVEDLEARNDAIVALDVAFSMMNDNDFETLNTVNSLVNTLLERYYIRIKINRNEVGQAEFEEFVATNEDKLFEILRKTVALLKEIQDLHDKDFFKNYHLADLDELYSFAGITSMLIDECDNGCFQMFDRFHEKFNELTKLVEEEMHFVANLQYQKQSDEDIRFILRDEKQSKFASYLFTEELQLRAIEIEPEFFDKIKHPTVAVMNKLKKVSPHLYVHYFSEPLPF